MAAYKHIFFDLDHTLWDFERNSQVTMEELWKEMLVQRMGTTKFKDFFFTYERVNDHWWGLYRKDQVTKEELRVGRFADTLKRFGTVDLYLADELATKYLARAPYMTHLFAGAIEVLVALRAEGYIMHIITNGFEEVQHIKLKETGLRDFFVEVITSEAAGAKKPDPSIFHYSMEKSAASVKNSLMIGDSLGSDILGAQGVGMDQIYFNPKGVKHDLFPTYEVSQLDEILPILIKT
jgi:putative hydrolase of the HAD superfamily